jgi:hypothetical protein
VEMRSVQLDGLGSFRVARRVTSSVQLIVV